MIDPLWLWLGFSGFVLAMLALDLGVFHRTAHVVSFRESLTWTAVWITLSVAFGAGVWHYAGSEKALEFYTGYLIELSLSVDNVFVFALILGAPFFIFWGWLSDRIGRRSIMTAGFALAVVSYWPVFTWLGAFQDNPVILTTLVWYMVILVTMVYGPIAAFLV